MNQNRKANRPFVDICNSCSNGKQPLSSMAVLVYLRDLEGIWKHQETWASRVATQSGWTWEPSGDYSRFQIRLYSWISWTGIIQESFRSQVCSHVKTVKALQICGSHFGNGKKFAERPCFGQVPDPSLVAVAVTWVSFADPYCSWLTLLTWWSLKHPNGLPSGYVKIAIENGHRNSGFTHWKWWFSIAMLVITRG